MNQAEESTEGRFRLTTLDRSDREPTFAEQVREGLLEAETKRLEPRWFYDYQGSLIFEEICELKEYYPTRCEREIIESRSRILAERLAVDGVLVELGSGSSSKTRHLIERILSRRGTLTYVPLDISQEMLVESSRALLADHPGLSIHALAGEYQAGVRHFGALGAAPRLVLFLGSNIGNFEPRAAKDFLRLIRAEFRETDRVLLGIDLAKDRDILEAAYDDAQGVTARFNLNLLARMNRELGADFDLESFEHQAIYREGAPGAVEMHLSSLRNQSVSFGQLDMQVDFEEGETIHTESSFKYQPAEIDALASDCGFRVEERWLDSESWFSLNLVRPV